MVTGVMEEIDIGNGFKDWYLGVGYNFKEGGQRRCFSSLVND